jgi:type II secretory pathway component PulJ
MMATAIFSIVSAALLTGFVSLKRNYAATTDFAINHADQMRISDYMAMDLRRAVRVDPPSQNDVSIYIPTYYDSTDEHNPVPRTPALDGKGGIYYGTPDGSVKVRYYLSGSAIYRQEGTKPAAEIATDVKDFIFRTTDLGKVVKTEITFRPTFRSSGATAQTALYTAFYNTTLLRNNRGVY